MIVIKISNLFNMCPYDIGDIFQTTNEVSPSTRWPGTKWESIQTFLVGASSERPVNSTGGEWTHTLTAQEIPAHTHMIQPRGVNDSAGVSTSQGNYPIRIYQDKAYNWNLSPFSTNSAGDNQPHNNTPPTRLFLSGKERHKISEVAR